MVLRALGALIGLLALALLLEGCASVASSGASGEAARTSAVSTGEAVPTPSPGSAKPEVVRFLVPTVT